MAFWDRAVEKTQLVSIRQCNPRSKSEGILQVRGASVEVQVKHLTTDVDGRQELGEVHFGGGVGNTVLVASGVASLPGLHLDAILAEGLAHRRGAVTPHGLEVVSPLDGDVEGPLLDGLRRGGRGHGGRRQKSD